MKKREMIEIQTDYTRAATKLGEVVYRLHLTSKEIEVLKNQRGQFSSEMERLNNEASKLKKYEGTEVVSEEAVPVTVPEVVNE